jgi:hypothetical protein
MGAKTFFANFFFQILFLDVFILLWGIVLKNLKLNKKYSKNQFGMIDKKYPILSISRFLCSK